MPPGDRHTRGLVGGLGEASSVTLRGASPGSRKEVGRQDQCPVRKRRSRDKGAVPTPGFCRWPRALPSLTPSEALSSAVETVWCFPSKPSSPAVYVACSQCEHTRGNALVGGVWLYFSHPNTGHTQLKHSLAFSVENTKLEFHSVICLRSRADSQATPLHEQAFAAFGRKASPEQTSLGCSPHKTCGGGTCGRPPSFLRVHSQQAAHSGPTRPRATP